MKKILLILAVALTSNLAYSQVGINSDDPKATLYIKSLENKDALRVDSLNGKQLMKVTDSGNVGIHVDAPTQPLHVKDGVRFRDMKSQLNDTINYRKILFSDDAGNVNTLPFDNYFVRELPSVRTIQYTTVTSELYSGNRTKDSSTVSLGIINARFNYSPSNNGYDYLQIMVNQTNFYSIYYEKSGAGAKAGPNSDSELRYYQKGEATAGNWINFPADFDALKRDMGTAIILLNNAKHVYRMTVIANQALQADNSIDLKAVPAQITIFLERLKDDY